MDWWYLLEVYVQSFRPKGFHAAREAVRAVQLANGGGVGGGGAAGIPRVDPSASPPARAVLWRKRVPAGLKAATRNTFYRTTAS